MNLFLLQYSGTSGDYSVILAFSQAQIKENFCRFLEKSIEKTCSCRKSVLIYVQRLLWRIMGLTGPDFTDSKHKENVSISHTSILRNSHDKVIVQPSLLRCQDIIALFFREKMAGFFGLGSSIPHSQPPSMAFVSSFSSFIRAWG